jgi:hypothetical protein
VFFVHGARLHVLRRQRQRAEHQKRDYGFHVDFFFRN